MISCIGQLIGVHHAKIHQYEHMYNGFQKYSFISIMIYYKKYKIMHSSKDKIFLINKTIFLNLLEEVVRNTKHN